MRHEATVSDGPADAGSLYERYSARILACCLHALHDRAEAEDAVQTTFLHAHRALRQGVVPRHEFAWLHTIAKNVCRTQRRTAARRAYVTGLDLDAIPAGERAAEERELLHDVDEALASLPEGQRRALVLREWRGLTSEEVAARLGMSAPATYALLTRARRSFARALTTTSGRSALGLNVWPLVVRLKAFLGSGAAKGAATTAVVAVAAGGITLERSLTDGLDRSGGPPRTAFDAGSAAVIASDGVPSPRPVVPTRPALRNRAVVTADAARPVGAPQRPETSHDVSPPTDNGSSAGSSQGAEPAGTSAEETVERRVDDAVRSTLELVPELPLPELPLPELALPEVDVEPGPVTELVPDEPVPFADAPSSPSELPLPSPPPLPLP